MNLPVHAITMFELPGGNSCSYKRFLRTLFLTNNVYPSNGPLRKRAFYRLICRHRGGAGAIVYNSEFYTANGTFVYLNAKPDL